MPIDFLQWPWSVPAIEPHPNCKPLIVGDRVYVSRKQLARRKGVGINNVYKRLAAGRAHKIGTGKGGHNARAVRYGDIVCPSIRAMAVELHTSVGTVNRMLRSGKIHYVEESSP